MTTTSGEIRLKVVASAVQFLRHPNVRDQPKSKQLAFLFKKGLTPQEASQAYRDAVNPPKRTNEGNKDEKEKQASSTQSSTSTKNSTNEGMIGTIRRAFGSLLSDDGEEEVEPVGDLSLPELSQFNGSLHERLLISVEGTIYDVTKRWDLYGPGKRYNVFTGADATFAFATMSVQKEDMNKFDVQLNDEQKEILGEWIAKYKKNKYPVVGKLVLTSKESK